MIKRGWDVYIFCLFDNQHFDFFDSGNTSVRLAKGKIIMAFIVDLKSEYINYYKSVQWIERSVIGYRRKAEKAEEQIKRKNLHNF